LFGDLAIRVSLRVRISKHLIYFNLVCFKRTQVQVLVMLRQIWNHTADHSCQPWSIASQS